MNKIGHFQPKRGLEIHLDLYEDLKPQVVGFA